MKDNGFWKVCAALNNPTRIALLHCLLESKKFPCVNEIADELDISVPVASLYLKQLREVRLVSCKRADKRIYYRAFPDGDAAEAVVDAFAGFFRTLPSPERIAELLKYIHALSHVRRHLVVRYCHEHPGEDILSLCRELDMPMTTASRIFNQLGKAGIVDLEFRVFPPSSEPELTLFKLTVTKPHF